MTSSEKQAVTAPDSDQHQRMRLRRTYFAAGGGGVLTAVLVLLHQRGQVRLDTGELVALLGGFWLVNLVFPALILTGTNLRLRDPGMTLAQMLWATASTFGMLYFVQDGRELVLMVYLLAMMFGAFRLDVSEYLLVTLVAVVLYAVVIAVLDHTHPRAVDLHGEAVSWLVFFFVMVGFSLLGSETSRLRARLQRRNRELQDARDSAAVAYQAKSRFLASTSHELRTPLNTILGTADVIDPHRLDDAGREALDRSHHAGRYLLSLVNSMIDLAQLESGAMELRRKPMDLAAEVTGVHEMMKPVAAGRRLGFRLRVDGELSPVVVGDAMRLREVLVHLLGNAIRHTHEGEVRLAAAKDGEDRVRFSVEDTGEGIARHRIPGLLQPSAAAGPGRGGSGLGLTLCSWLVEHMGGALELESSPGEGSRFSFSIPLPPAPDRRQAPAGLASSRVLVVDDSEDNRLLIRAFLKGSVRSLDEAADGMEGVERYRQGQHDVVLMDMHMPRMDGIEATRAIREMEGVADGARAVILALTADDSIHDRSRSLEAGCDDHLVKPVSKKALLAALAAHTPVA